MPARIEVGPVIGTVTATTVRVLVETNRDISGVRCTAMGTDGSASTTTFDLERNRPHAASLTGLNTGLNPATAYTLNFEDLEGSVQGRFQTRLESPQGMNLAALS